MRFKEPIHIIDGKRSAIGRFGGALKDVPAAELALQVARAVVSEGLREHVDQVILGQVLQAGTGMNVARQVGLKLGVPQESPAYTVNMVCGSGLKAVGLGAEQIALGEAELVLAGGVENMSRAPHYLDSSRFGVKLGDGAVRDAIMVDGLSDPTLNIGMGETAENLADAFRISREDQDAFAAECQQRVKAAGGSWRREIVAVETGKVRFEMDEQPRPDSSVEKLAGLRPAFRKDGTVTAGNSSGINDGTAMVLLGSDAACARHGLVSRGRIVGYTVTGCDPAVMGIGPVGAIRLLCEQVGWRLEDVDAVEINEAFAVQTLACARQLELSEAKLNQRGGAIALGHPIGASGTRVVVTLSHLMEDKGYKKGIASLCVGGGMGVAMAIELP